MLRTGPRFRVEEKRDCVLIWNERDWSLPRRMVASFPSHPYDKNEAAILAEICAAALNRELPGRVAGDPEEGSSREEQERAIHELPLHEEEGRKAAPPKAPAAAPSCVGAVREPPALAPAQGKGRAIHELPLQEEAPPATKRERKPMPDVSHLQGRDKAAAICQSLFGEDA